VTAVTREASAGMRALGAGEGEVSAAEYHVECGGTVRIRDAGALEWRCDRCKKLVPVTESTTKRPAKAATKRRRGWR